MTETVASTKSVTDALAPFRAKRETVESKDICVETSSTSVSRVALRWADGKRAVSLPYAALKTVELVPQGDGTLLLVLAFGERIVRVRGKELEKLFLMLNEQKVRLMSEVPKGLK